MLFFYLFLIVLYFLTLVLPGLSHPIPLFPQGDEIMHIRTIRETITQGKWILPELSGLPNPYKPPLLFWLGILADTLLNVSFLSERLVSFVFGLGSSLLVFQIVRSFERSNLYSFLLALCYAASFGTWKFSRLLMMEQGMTFFVLLFFWIYSLYERKRKKGFLILGSFTLGIGYFFKGPILLIYGFILVFSFFFVDVFRIRKKAFYLSSKNMRKYIPSSILLISIALPILWLIYLFLFEPSGKKLIHFFFINENAGKFNSENQSAFRILGGWFLYSLPYTIVIGHSLILQLKSRVCSRRTRVSRALLFSLFFLTIFHLLPNRKDSYYVVSFLPILFISIGLSHSFEYFKVLFLNHWNLTGLLIVYLLSILFSIHSKQLLAVFILSCYSVITALMVFSKKKHFMMIYILFMITVPSIGYLVVLPNLDPVIAKDLEEYKINEYCFVSENPWNAMEFQNQSPSSRIIYSPPSASKHLCELKSIPILSFSSFYSPAGHYQATKEWQVWNSHQTFDVRDAIHFFQNSGFLNFKSKISLYEVQHP